MANGRQLFSSESVTEGHPDKMCDQISDAILDRIMEKDPMGRVAVESLVTTGLIVIAGEITTGCYVDMQKVARETVQRIGYTDAKYGFDYETCGVIISIKEQSKDIARGVDKALEIRGGEVMREDLEKLGAGDQGLMFGFACDETEELMPMPIMLAHKLARRLTEVRKSGELNYLRPDGKSQIAIEYDNGYPIRIDSVLISCQHSPDKDYDQLRSEIIEKVITPIIPQNLVDKNIKYFVNPTGRFVVGGPHGDTGVTGRKIIVDTYGGYSRHGGGAFSGKDPTKVDRSASYAVRYLAKNVVAAQLAKKCEVQVAYAIGVARPLSVMVDTFGTGKIADEKIAKILTENFDLRPGFILKKLGLRRPIYQQVAAYGHFGRDDLVDVPWEKVDLVPKLKKAAKT